MKKVSLLSMFVAIMLFCGNAFAQTVLINDDFEAYTVGNKIAVEAQAAGNSWWTTWSNNPGSNEDGVVATNVTKCGHMTYNNDQVLLCGGIESGSYDLEFDILVPQGKNGYFNILHNFNGSGSTWAMQAYLHLTNDGSESTAAPGHGTIHAGSNGTADIPCVYDEWMHFRLHVDTDLDEAKFFYSSETTYATEQCLCTWQWSLDSFGTNTVGRKLDAMDFFPPENTATSEYYLDNFTLTQIGEDTAASLEFDTDALEGWLEEDDAMSIDINISNAEGTSIGDWTAWVDFGEGAGGSQTSQINYDAEVESFSTVGFTGTETTLFEIAAMYPGSTYAGAAMGAKIVSVQLMTFLEGSDGTANFAANEPITFRVYGQGLNGQPGEILAEKVVPYNQLSNADWTVATFDEPVALTGYNVWISAEYKQPAGGHPIPFDAMSYLPNSGFYRSNGGGAFNTFAPEVAGGEDDYGCMAIRANVQGATVPATWATLSKPEGSIAVGGEDSVEVNINTIGLSEGDVMEAEVVFVTNDPEKPVVEIPLTLHVSGASVAENTENVYGVYPNPTTGKVTVEGENIVAISVYNAAGQLINIVSASSNNTTVVMNTAGVYFLNIIDKAGNTTVQRVVVE